MIKYNQENIQMTVQIVIYLNGASMTFGCFFKFWSPKVSIVKHYIFIIKNRHDWQLISDTFGSEIKNHPKVMLVPSM